MRSLFCSVQVFESLHFLSIHLIKPWSYDKTRFSSFCVLAFHVSISLLFSFKFSVFYVLNSISSQKTLSNNINFILTILKSQRQISDFLRFIVSFW